MKRLFFFLILLSWQTIAMATLSMKVEPSTAQLGETIQLTLSHDRSSPSGIPDFTPLEKDFTLVGTGHNMSYSVTNGVAKSESQWVVQLIAKKSGVINIPAISLGQESSAPGQVTITSNTKTTSNDNPTTPQEDDSVMLHAEISTSKPFVNEQMIYTVKLYSRKQLMNAAYQPPRVENAILIPLGEGRRYQTTLNSHEYGVDEQQYAIFSQKSGEMKITPPGLNAVVYDTVPRHIHLDGTQTPVVVKPIPKKNTQQHWLPAKHVALTEQYDPSVSSIAQGDTIVRTITLQAEAMPAELLPVLEFTDNKQYSVYPEKPETRNALRQQELIGTSSIKVTYLPTQAGRITLPEIKVTWFNTLTGKPETATLPEHILTVTAKIGTKATPPTAATSTPPQPQPIVTAPTGPFYRLAWWIAGAFAVAWGLTLALWWRFRHRSIMPKQNLRSTLANLHQACATNDPALVHVAILNWGRLQWPEADLFNLSQLSNLIHDLALKQQINLLSQALYRQNGQSDWCGNALWRAVKSLRVIKSTQKPKRHDLPPMNPL